MSLQKEIPLGRVDGEGVTDDLQKKGEADLLQLLKSGDLLLITYRCLSKNMVYLHYIYSQEMPKAPQISGQLHNWYSRKKPPYEGRLSVTQQNNTTVSMWAQFLKVAISKSD